MSPGYRSCWAARRVSTLGQTKAVLAVHRHEDMITTMWDLYKWYNYIQSIISCKVVSKICRRCLFIKLYSPIAGACTCQACRQSTVSATKSGLRMTFQSLVWSFVIFADDWHDWRCLWSLLMFDAVVFPFGFWCLRDPWRRPEGLYLCRSPPWSVSPFASYLGDMNVLQDM